MSLSLLYIFTQRPQVWCAAKPTMGQLSGSLCGFVNIIVVIIIRSG